MAKRGAGIQYIDEDLSGAYDGNRRYDDEARKAAGVQYIDEDLSGAYKQKNSEEQQVKPSPYDMMNYWKFSQLYSGSLARKGRDEGADRGEGSLADENMNAEAAKTPSDLSEEEKTGETKHNAQSSWAQSPSMNEMMNALSWLDKQGVNLAEVKKTETIPEDPDDNEVEEKPEETEEITIDSPGPSSKDMADTLDWLTKKGFSSVQKEKTNDLVSSSSSGNTEETKDNIQSEVAELEKRSGPPASNNMIDALRWLESRGFEANKPRIGNSKFSPDHNTDGARKTEGSVPNENSLTNEGNSVPVKDVLYELSWLHTHGFDLDRASGDASQQGTTSVTPEKEMGNHTGTDGKSKNRDDAPTMKEMMDALNWVESKKPKTKAEPKLVPSVDEANDTMPTQPTKILSDDTSTKPDSTASKDMEFALKWLEKRGITASLQDKSTPSGHAKTESRKKTKSVKQRPSSRMSTRNMTSALDWLQKRNFSVINKKKNLDREKKAASQEPSAQDLKTALHSLKEKEGKTDVAGPSIRDMEDALKWMKIQEGAKKPKRALPKKVADEDPMKDPNWMGEGEEAKTSFVGDVSDDSEDNLDNIESKKSKSGENTKKREKTKLEPKKTRSSSKSKKKRGSSRDKKKSSSRTSSRRTSKAGKEVTVKKDAEKRASSRLSGSEMERTLKWLQNKAGSATVKQDSPEPFSPKNQPKKKEKKDASESGMDYKNALSWLHTKKADNVEDITYFKKLDAMLPKKGSQSIEARAREIAKAMKWVRKQETKGNSKTQKDDPIDTTEKESSAVDPKLINDGVHNFHSGKSAIEDVPKDTNTNQPKVASEIRQEEEIAIERTPSDNEPKKKEKAEMTQAELDCENALTWLKTKQAESVEDVTYFRKLDAILPKKASQTLEARAKEMAKAMKWVKKQGILGGPKKDVDDEAGKQSESTSEPKGKIGSTKQKNTSSDPTVARNRKETKVSKDLGDPVNKSPVRSPTRGKISLMTMTKKNVKDVTSVKDSLKSLRRQKKNVSSKDTSEKKAVISSPSNTNDRDFTNAIAWLESKNPEGLEDANFFKKLDSMLPKKQGQSTEDRAKEIVKALSWVRKTQGQETDQAYNKRDPKDAKKQKAKSDWKKLKKSLKGKPKQEKAKEKARTVAPTIMQDDDTDGSGKKGVASNDDRGQTGDRVKSSKDRDLENALDFIKIKEEGGDFMQVEDASSFKKLDNMLPKKASQKPEDRAKEMVKMLAWMKKKNLNAVNR